MERRHRGDSALGRDVFEFVDVDLDEFNFRVLGRQFLEERRDGLARSAPARGEINDDLFRATRVRGVTSSVFARLASVFARRSIDVTLQPAGTCRGGQERTLCCLLLTELLP